MHRSLLSPLLLFSAWSCAPQSAAQPTDITFPLEYSFAGTIEDGETIFLSARPLRDLDTGRLAIRAFSTLSSRHIFLFVGTAEIARCEAQSICDIVFAKDVVRAWPCDLCDLSLLVETFEGRRFVAHFKFDKP